MLSERVGNVLEVFASLPSASRITCVLYQGGGMKLLDSLDQMGYPEAHLFFARGQIVGEPASGTFGLSVPKEVVVVLCPKEDADELFTWIFESQKIGEPYQGFMYMTSISAVAPALEGKPSAEDTPLV